MAGSIVILRLEEKVSFYKICNRFYDEKTKQLISPSITITNDQTTDFQKRWTLLTVNQLKVLTLVSSEKDLKQPQFN